jgi:hypothetical protein
MLITTFYNTNNNNNNNNTNNNNKLYNKQEEYDFCFICYEIQIENEKKPLKLYTQPYYVKSCYCDGFIHKYCLDKWYSLSESCPICREFIIYKKMIDFNISYIYHNSIDTIDNNTIDTIDTIDNNTIYMFNILQKIIFSIAKYFMLMIIFWNIYLIYDNANKKYYVKN